MWSFKSLFKRYKSISKSKFKTNQRDCSQIILQSIRHHLLKTSLFTNQALRRYYFDWLAIVWWDFSRYKHSLFMSFPCNRKSVARREMTIFLITSYRSDKQKDGIYCTGNQNLSDPGAISVPFSVVWNVRSYVLCMIFQFIIDWCTCAANLCRNLQTYGGSLSSQSASQSDCIKNALAFNHYWNVLWMLNASTHSEKKNIWIRSKKRTKKEYAAWFISFHLCFTNIIQYVSSLRVISLCGVVWLSNYCFCGFARCVQFSTRNRTNGSKMDACEGKGDTERLRTIRSIWTESKV